MRNLATQTSHWFSSFKHHAILFAAVFCLLSATAPAEAGLLFDIAPNSAAPGTSGSLEVTLTNTGPGPLDFISVAGFSFEIRAAGTDVTFSDVTTLTSLFPYIFPGSDSTFGPGSLAPTINPDGNTISALDIYGGSSPTGVTLNPFETVSLGLVSYSLSNSATSGLIPITFTAYPATNVNDSVGDLPVTLSSTGGLNVVVASIPEPSSVTLMLLGSFGIAIGIYRRRSLEI